MEPDLGGGIQASRVSFLISYVTKHYEQHISTVSIVIRCSLGNEEPSGKYERWEDPIHSNRKSSGVGGNRLFVSEELAITSSGRELELLLPSHVSRADD